MRALVLYADPVETSFQAALHRTAVDALRTAGHEVDDCDLYAENFNPVLSRQERIDYQDMSVNRRPVESYVARLLAAEGLVLIFPVWNFGYPAILKGFFDRVFLPGVSFELVAGKARPRLNHIRRVIAVTTYGGGRFRAILMGDPPRRSIKRVLRALVPLSTRVSYLAYYDMNRSTEASRHQFLGRVARVVSKL